MHPMMMPDFGFLPPQADFYQMMPFEVIQNGMLEQEYARILAEEARSKMMSSRKERPKKFKCPHCEHARFSNNGQLKSHIRTHTGERPFKCESCSKTFTRNEELTRHKRIHSGIRPFACSSCGKKFGRRDHLKKHMKTHLAQEKYNTVLLPVYPPFMYGFWISKKWKYRCARIEYFRHKKIKFIIENLKFCLWIISIDFIHP